jgi:predicted CXXCH cytochrome family protein
MKMKKLFTLIFVLAMAQVSFGQISSNLDGTAHDFSGDAWATSNAERCNVCHTPHNALSANGPLWNHVESAVSNYTLYDSPTLQAADLGDPTGASKLCMSCHDGTVAIDAFGGNATPSIQIAATANVGGGTLGGTTGDLSNDHPVSFTYGSVLWGLDDELQDPQTATTSIGGTIEDDLLFGTDSGLKTMECATCHDVHGTGNSFLLRISNANSDLCLTCHIK